MKVLGISGSARKDGNTATLLKTVLGALGPEGVETELIQLSGRSVEPCKACFACVGKGNCVHRGDAFCETFDKMVQADGIVLGSPAYSANVSALMQAFLERAAVVVDTNPGLLKRKAAAAVAPARRAGALAAVDSMNRFFLNHEMLVVGSTYWNVAYGQLPGDVGRDEEGLVTMKALGGNMAYLLKLMERGD